MKFFAPILALSATALAATKCDDAKATITISSPADATIDCKTVAGSIVFEEGATVSGSVDISGPQRIKGDLIVHNATGIINLSSSTISEINGKLELTIVEALTTVSFSKLKTVGEIEWVTLPQLERVTFGTEGVTTVSKVRISDTFLPTLDGVNLVSVDTFQIDNNRRLNKWETKLANITDKLTISSNSANFAVDFPELIWASSLEIRGIESLKVPSLKRINQSLSLANNTAMESFFAPNLTEVGADLEFGDNKALTNLSFPILEVVGGGLAIFGNNEIKKLEAFPKLTKVGGAINLRGAFESVELPALNDVKGTFDLISTATIQGSCDELSKLSKESGNGKIQAKFTCEGESNDSSKGGSKPINGNSDSENSAAGVGINTVVLFAVVAGAAAQLL